MLAKQVIRVSELLVSFFFGSKVHLLFDATLYTETIIAYIPFGFTQFGSTFFFYVVVESKKQFRWFHNTASMATKTLKIPTQCAVFYDTKVLTVLFAFSPTRPLRWLLPQTLRWFTSTLSRTLRRQNQRSVFRRIRCCCFRRHRAFTGKLCFLAEVSALLRCSLEDTAHDFLWLTRVFAHEALIYFALYHCLRYYLCFETIR